MKIGLITDIHGNLEALKVVLLDMKEKGISDIYCLGDMIGLGNHSSACLDLLMENQVHCIRGNSEEYAILGTSSFPYLKQDGRYDNAVWTKKQLSKHHLSFLESLPHTIELEIEGNKIALCHFPNDVRYDFFGIVSYKGKRLSRFFQTNTKKDWKNHVPKTEAYFDALSDPLFFGKPVTSYDIILYGHYHFHREHHQKGITFYSLNATGVAIEKEAIYYILSCENGKITLIQQKVPYPYQKLWKELDNTDYPNKKQFEKYIAKQKNSD